MKEILSAVSLLSLISSGQVSRETPHYLRFPLEHIAPSQDREGDEQSFVPFSRYAEVTPAYELRAPNRLRSRYSSSRDDSKSHPLVRHGFGAQHAIRTTESGYSRKR